MEMSILLVVNSSSPPHYEAAAAAATAYMMLSVPLFVAYTSTLCDLNSLHVT